MELAAPARVGDRCRRGEKKRLFEQLSNSLPATCVCRKSEMSKVLLPQSVGMAAIVQPIFSFTIFYILKFKHCTVNSEAVNCKLTIMMMESLRVIKCVRVCVGAKAI